MTTITTATGHTLTIDHDRLWLVIGGDTETMDRIPDAEIDAACAAEGVYCTWDVIDETTYRVREVRS